MDSLNSCWRLGQTTSFNSSNVSARNPLLREGSASGAGLDAVVSSDVGLVTGLRPEADAGADAHAGKQTPYRITVLKTRQETEEGRQHRFQA
jgi:hypothetical protein